MSAVPETERMTPAEAVEASWAEQDGALESAWQVDKAEGTELHAEPKPEPDFVYGPEEREADAEVIRRVGADPAEAQEFLDSNPAVVAELEASGAFVRNPKTEEQLAANAAVVELARVRQAQAQEAATSANETAFALAVRAYEEEGADPAEIADVLFANRPEVAADFVRYWRSEEGHDEEDDVEPLTPDEWIAGKQQALDAQTFIQNMHAEQAEQAEVERVGREIAAVSEKFGAAHPAEWDAVVAFANDLAPEGVSSAAETKKLLEASLRGVREMASATAKAHIQADLETDAAVWADGWMPSPGAPRYDAEAAFARNEARNVNLDRLAPKPSFRDEARAALAPSAAEAALDASWGVGASPTASKISLFARQRGLPLNAPEVVKQALREGWRL